MDFNITNSLLKIVILSLIVSTIIHSYKAYHNFKPMITQQKIELATDPLIEKYTYVDKTGFVLKLLQDENQHYFFSRPRRFGKTTFLRTVKAIFDHHRKGERIFNGTNIWNSGHNWDEEKYPVMYFDLSVDTLETAFNEELERFKSLEEITYIPKQCVSISNNITKLPLQVRQFREILCTASRFGKRRPVVILVDEYDHHILQESNNPAALEIVAHFLRTFCLHLKASASYIKLALVTGITRSSFLHYGSSGGDFFDISDVPKYGAIAGITEGELTQYFQHEIERIAVKRQVDQEDIRTELKRWYNGYSFTSDLEKVYNPKSIQRYFATGVANIYWPQEGRASFFWDQLMRRPIDFSNIKENVYSNLRYAGSINQATPENLMYDTGYLTIDLVDHTNENSPYKLCFPNKEVRSAFFIDFVEATKKNNSGELDNYIIQMKKALSATPEPDFNTFIAIADTAIRFWPFRCRFEEGYNLHLAALMYMAGFNVQPQRYSELAIIDLIDISSETILLFELKLDHDGFTEAWKATRRSIDVYFFRQKKILAAGISLTSQRPDTVVAGWRAELYTSNGTLLRTYRHEESEWYKNWRHSARTPRSTRKLKVLKTTKP